MTKRLDKRSYKVRTDEGKILRRNRVQMKPSREQPQMLESDLTPSPKSSGKEPKQSEDLPQKNIHMDTPVKKSTPNVPTSRNIETGCQMTRSGRISRQPEYLIEYKQ